jgi:hypothetical protein
VGREQGIGRAVGEGRGTARRPPSVERGGKRAMGRARTTGGEEASGVGGDRMEREGEGEGENEYDSWGPQVLVNWYGVGDLGD